MDKAFLFKQAILMLNISNSFLPIGGGSRAFDKNCPTDPRRSSLMESANSCRGVLNISGVMYSSILSYLDIVNRIVTACSARTDLVLGSI